MTENSTLQTSTNNDNFNEKLRRFRNRMKWEFRVAGWIILFVGIYLVFNTIHAVVWTGISLIIFAAISLVVAETVWKEAGKIKENKDGISA